MIFFYYIIKQFFLSLPDLYSVVSNILGLVSPESYRVSYPVTKRVRRATLHHKSAPWSSTHLVEGNLPRPQSETSYIVTLDPETTDYFLPTWQVIRPGNPRATGQPPPTISEYEERRHLRYHPIIRVNSLNLSF